jgi:mono/diheme cytochrome c family protein
LSDQLSAAAQAMGVPEPIVERSARARAAASGKTYEEILAAWAGGQAVAAAPAAEAPAEAAPEAEAPAEAGAAAPEPAAPPTAPAAPAPAEPAPAAAAASVAPPPAPETVTPEEALEYPVVVTVPTAGIAERTGFSIPTWLGALLLLIPAFGLIYLAMGSGATECGAGTALAADRVTGEQVNCDGTPFEGRGAAGGGADFIAMGEELYTSAQCAGCHGPQGGGGVGPALAGVSTTFSACTDHVEWVELGSQGFLSAGRSTYGDTGKRVAGGMPGFGGSLTAEQIAAVAAFERVRFGGANPDEVLVDCGLAEGEGGEEGGEEGAEDGGETTDTAGGGEETTDTTAGTEAARSSRSG